MKKRLLSLLLAVLMCCSLVLPAEAALTPAPSGNVQYQSYHDGSGIFSRWAMPVWSYLHACADGMERVEYIPGSSGARLVVEQYAMDGKITGQKALSIELPIFGGFFAGSDANYVVFGKEQTTKTGSDSEEVIRVVRYSKAWQRLDSVSLYGENTTIPFDAGSLRMTEDGAYLYVHTCHEMYAIDEVNHQANLTFCVRKSDMTITDVRSAVMNDEYGYVSHSFNQFLALDGDRLITLDHGDASPRSAYLYRHKAVNSSGKFLPNFNAEGYALRGEGVNLMTFNDSGYNETGANLGGLAVTGTHYLAVGSSVDQTADGVDLDKGQRNVFVAAVPKDNLTDAAVQVRWLTSYTDLQVFTPQLVQVSENRCLLLWCTGEGMHYVFLKADGSADGPICTADASLSDCAPTVIDGRVWWYSTEHWSYPEHTYFVYFDKNYYEDEGAVPTFYCIDPANPGTVTAVKAAGDETVHEHTLALQNAKTASCETAGYTGDQVCTVCGEVVEKGKIIPATGHKTVLRNARSAACETAGYTGDWVCTVCGETVQQGKALPALGHAFGAWQVTRPAAADAEGEQVRACTRCGERETRAIARLAPANPFRDVAAGAYYYEPVLWAVNHTPQITNGTSGDTFSPDAICTRGQIVTFLWRAKGCPEPKRTLNPFEDVSAGAYYYKAVLWAVENEITNGIDETHFAPGASCTRAQAVTFLWRAEGKPSAGAANPFKDVADGAYYYEPVLWAVNHVPQITNGMGADTFSPGEYCTRGQIVTFLYRDLAG